jgi:hypothetical protein
LIEQFNVIRCNVQQPAALGACPEGMILPREKSNEIIGWNLDQALIL